MLAGGVLAVAGLVACNSAEADPEPEPTAPTVPGATETEPEPEPTEPDDEVGDGVPDDDPPGQQEYEHPVPGEDIDDDGQAGAEAAAVYFVELYSYVYATGDLAAWEDLTAAEGCNFCASVHTRVSDLYGEGGHGLSGSPSIESVSTHVWPESDGDYAIEVVFQSPALTLYGADGEELTNYVAGRGQAWIVVEYAEGAWIVRGAEAGDFE